VLENFDIRLEFGPRGEVTKAQYEDGDGCGHSREFAVGVGSMTTLQELIEYHLNHYWKSHKQKPKELCGYKARGYDDQSRAMYVCRLEPHPETPNNHMLTWEGVEGG